MNLAAVPADVAVLGILLAVLLVPQAVLVLRFWVRVRARGRAHRGRDADRMAAAHVPAEVVLCLRGRDATLDRVLMALAGQSHRHWRLRVVVDSRDDPAWDATHAALTRFETSVQPTWSGWVVEPLAARPARGSLKCAALRQALAALAPETAVVAFVDADSIVHRDWLLTLVDECTREGVGAASGNRWFDPDVDAAAALVRAMWNAGAIVQMTIYDIPWGGSLAVRREAVEGSRWREVIASSLCEDTALAAPLAAAGWTFRHVPALTAVDRDDSVTIRQVTRWIARQLLTARLHHPLWPLVALHAVSTSLALAAAPVCMVAALATGRYAAAGGCAAMLAAYEVVNALLLVAIVHAVRETAVVDEPIRPLAFGRLCRWIAYMPATQAVYAAATFLTLTARSVEWRGVAYDIRRAGRVAEVAIIR